MPGSQSIHCTEKPTKRAGIKIANEQNKAEREMPPSGFRADFLDPPSLSNVIDFLECYRQRRF